MQPKRLISVILFCLYMAAVAYLCFAKPDDMPKLPELWFGLPADKAGHFLMFVPFTLLSFMVFDKDRMSLSRKIVLLCILFICGAGMAIGTERIQAATAYRSAEIADMAADFAGLSVGALVTFILIFVRKK